MTAYKCQECGNDCYDWPVCNQCCKAKPELRSCVDGLHFVTENCDCSVAHEEKCPDCGAVMIEVCSGLEDMTTMARKCKAESGLQPLKDHLISMIEYSKDAGALSFPMVYELHQKTMEAVAILIRIEDQTTKENL